MWSLHAFLFYKKFQNKTVVMGYVPVIKYFLNSPLTWVTMKDIFGIEYWESVLFMSLSLHPHNDEIVTMRNTWDIVIETKIKFKKPKANLAIILIIRSVYLKGHLNHWSEIAKNYQHSVDWNMAPNGFIKNKLCDRILYIRNVIHSKSKI